MLPLYVEDRCIGVDLREIFCCGGIGALEVRIELQHNIEVRKTK